MKNIQSKIKKSETIPHFGLRKLSVGLASMLLSTTLFLGNNANTTHAATNNDGDNNENDESVENSQDADDFARPTDDNDPSGTAGQTVDPKDTNATHRADAPKGAAYVLDPENVSSGEIGPNGHYENPVTHAPVDPKLLWNNNSTLTIHLNTIKNGTKSNVSTHTITVSFARRDRKSVV